MKVLVIGAGGRDHALVWKLAQSPLATELHAAPGNVGMSDIATCHPVDMEDFDGIVALAQRLRIDLAVVGLETQLVAGLASRLQEAGVPCLGPTQEAAQLEGSKLFAKQLMHDLGIPTARWEEFSDASEARQALRDRWPAPVVVKADGLAGGRGAFVCMTDGEAQAAVDSLLVDHVFGNDAGSSIIIEEFLVGREASVMVACDGTTALGLPAARDFKRLHDGDEGPNTGGMGAFAPSTDVTPDDVQMTIELAVLPVLEELRRRGTPYRGVMYVGLLMTDDGPRVLEYNCRFGNPETQALVRCLDADLLELLSRTATGSLEGVATPTTHGCAVAVCLATASYPARDFEPMPVDILGVDDAGRVSGVEVFLGMTERVPGEGDMLRAAGGRPVTVTALAGSLDEAAARAYEAAERISFPGRHFRRDIAAQAVAAQRS